VVSRAANECEVWRDLLGREPTFATLEQYALQVPIVDKHALFVDRPWTSLVCGGDLRRLEATLLSSGTTSRIRAAGLFDGPTRMRSEARLGAALRMLFATDRHRSILLNMLPDGVPLAAPGVVTQNTGGRVVLGLERALGRAGTLDPVRLRVIVGGHYLHEHTRSRLCALLGVEPDHDRCNPAIPISSMGTSELGMHCLWETPSTIALRRALLRTPEQLARVCLEPPEAVPCLMTYDPDHTYVEIIAGELVVTRLDDTLLQPIIRYNTHDPCGHVDRERAIEFLADVAPELARQLPDPLIWLHDRTAATGRAV
jgi:hypothetical protein